MTADDRGTAARRRPAWLTAPVLTVSVLSIAAGIAQFSLTTVIGDVAATFGEPGAGDEAVQQIGLPATTVGIALTVVRLASLGSLPAAALADRVGRRTVLLATAAVGLTLTSLAAAAPSFWWYVALVAFARPALSTVNALAGVVAAEESRANDRSAALALIAVAYGLGSGIVAVGRGLLPGDPSFRLVMAFALVPLLLLPLLARRIREPRIVTEHRRAVGLPGRIPRRYVPRVTLLAVLTGTLALATGPGFTYLFVYGERVLGSSPLYLSMLVLGAGPVGLVGILVGRWAADRFGRRVSAGVSMALTGAGVAFAYSGGTLALAVGYLAALGTSSAFAPPGGALVAELVPTRIRATLAGWETIAGVLGASLGLLGFGVLADVTSGFDSASQLIGVIVAIAAVGFTWLPETLGTELEDLEEPTGS
ncbi:MAG: MFS transporter [Nitriliruptoraceae bacterium]